MYIPKKYCKGQNNGKPCKSTIPYNSIIDYCGDCYHKIVMMEKSIKQSEETRRIESHLPFVDEIQREGYNHINQVDKCVKKIANKIKNLTKTDKRNIVKKSDGTGYGLCRSFTQSIYDDLVPEGILPKPMEGLFRLIILSMFDNIRFMFVEETQSVDYIRQNDQPNPHETNALPPPQYDQYHYDPEQYQYDMETE